MPSLLRTILDRAVSLLPAGRSMSPGGWYGIIREPYTGAWQANAVELAPESVLQNPTVFRCISLIATDVAKCTLRLMVLDPGGVWTETTNPAWTPVLRKPNRYQTIGQLLEAWMSSKLIWGNTYVLKLRDGRGVVNALHVMNPRTVTPLIAPDGGVYYEIHQSDLAGLLETEGRPPILPGSEVIHDRSNCLFHPLIGIPPLYACGGPAVQGLKMQEHSTAFFANGSQPAGVLLVPGPITQAQADKVLADWKQTHGGINRGGTAILPNGMTYNPITQTATDAQLTEQLAATARTIAGAFGVPISMVDSSQQPPYANSAASLLQYHPQSLQTHLPGMEACLDEGLELPTQYGTEFDVDDLIWMATENKTKAAAEAIGSGAMSPNEGRFKTFHPRPLPGGDAPYMQQQYYSLEALATREPPATPDPTSPTPPAREPEAEPEAEEVPT